MRISYWSSDVCSSDLGQLGPNFIEAVGPARSLRIDSRRAILLATPVLIFLQAVALVPCLDDQPAIFEAKVPGSPGGIILELVVEPPLFVERRVIRPFFGDRNGVV